jgi:hypothetical protein
MLLGLPLVALWVVACPFLPFEDDFGKTCDPDLNQPCSEGLICEPEPESELGGVCVPPRPVDAGPQEGSDGGPGDTDGG